MIQGYHFERFRGSRCGSAAKTGTVGSICRRRIRCWVPIGVHTAGRTRRTRLLSRASLADLSRGHAFKFLGVLLGDALELVLVFLATAEEPADGSERRAERA